MRADIYPGQGGWKHDGVSGGKVIFVVDEDKADIQFQDTSGRLRSHAAEGSEVRIVSGDLFGERPDLYRPCRKSEGRYGRTLSFPSKRFWTWHGSVGYYTL